MTRRQRQRVRRAVFAIAAAAAGAVFFVMLGIVGSIEREVISGAEGAVKLAASGLLFVGFALIADVFYRAQRADR